MKRIKFFLPLILWVACGVPTLVWTICSVMSGRSVWMAILLVAIATVLFLIITGLVGWCLLERWKNHDD